jgi:hypothetical protein
MPCFNKLLLLFFTGVNIVVLDSTLLLPPFFFAALRVVAANLLLEGVTGLLLLPLPSLLTGAIDIQLSLPLVCLFFVAR